jgi:hypothetical protein
MGLSSNAWPTLRKTIGAEAMLDLQGVLDSSKSEWANDVLEISTERFERRLAEEVGGLRQELYAAMNELRLAVVREMASTRAELLKWSFLFWVGQLAGVAAIVSFLLRNS